MDSPMRVLSPGQPVQHAGRPATFLHMSGGVAIIRHGGEGHAVAVPAESLSLLPADRPLRSPLAAADEPLSRDSRH